MSRTLILMRHAKSSWDDFTQPDHARVLNKRGRSSAAGMGKWLTEQEYLPTEVLCSSAERTRETWARLGLGCDVVRYEDALYHAGPDVMLRILQSAKSDTVLMLGHNPGIAAFAEMLVTASPSHPRFHDYPTCATTVITWEEDDWHTLGYGRGTAKAFAIPREVMGPQNVAD